MDADPLLRHAVPISGVVDHRGRPASRSATGRWTAALFIIGFNVAERFAYYGVSSNLITYLTGPLQESTAAAAANVNAWSGVASMLPLLGAFIADSYLGRYRTILIATILYLLGLAMLTLSAALPAILSPKCSNAIDPTACPPTSFQVAAFYFSLYLIACALGGHKPCVQAFGADQFDESDTGERKSKSSFFNWWFFGLTLSSGISIFASSYIQDNFGWGIGFGTPCIAMALGLIIFLLGTRTYRYYLLEDENPFARIARAFAALIRSRRTHSPVKCEGMTRESPLPDAAVQSRLSDGSESLSATKEDEDVHMVRQLEEAKGVLRLFPIWATCLIYAVVAAQSTTFFTKQGGTLDRRIGRSFQVPAAALQSFVSIAIVTFIPIYDRVLVPIARKFSGQPSGLTMLQRIGVGMILSVIVMVIAALVEMKRLRIARDFGLVDQPKATIPMSFWWLVPQYLVFGMAEVFAMVGLQEFFYDQVPDALRSLGLALYFTIIGIGNFLSSLLVSLIETATTREGESWFSNNLNRAHLDYFYWLLAGLNTIGVIFYLYFARSYIYKKKEFIMI